MSAQNKGYVPESSFHSDAALYGSIVEAMLTRVQTCTLVRVTAVKNVGEVAPIGLIDVIPMVHQIASDGSPVPLAEIFNVPYFRLHGGKNAVIVDPEIGDMGMCVFASRDLSSVVKTKADAPPASMRKHDYADGLYIGGFLSVAAPMQYLRFKNGEVTVHGTDTIRVEGQKIILDAPETECTGNLTVAKKLTYKGGMAGSGGGANGSQIEGGFKVNNGDILADDISLKNHLTTGVTPGGGISGEPTA